MFSTATCCLFFLLSVFKTYVCLDLSIEEETMCDILDATDIGSLSGLTGWTCTPDGRPTDDFCQWTGVFCSSGHISSLDLSFNRLNGLASGTIPVTIGHLTYLTNLNFEAAN